MNEMIPPGSSPARDDGKHNRSCRFPDWRDPLDSSPTGDGGKSLTLVRECDGQTRVRWRRITRSLAPLAAGTLLGSAIVSRFASRPLSVLACGAAIPLCVASAYLVLVIEVQTQRLRSGQWRFRFSMRAVLLWTAIVAVCLALATNAYRDKQRIRAENQQLKQELDAVVNGGNVSMDMPWGGNIVCRVTRSAFSDDDLARIIDLASQGGTRTCELSSLRLAGTNITNAGVCRLSACEQLRFLDLPPIDLSDEAINSLAKCRRLEILMIDERKLTAKHIDRLRTALPDVRLNGLSWQFRQR